MYICIYVHIYMHIHIIYVHRLCGGTDKTRDGEDFISVEHLQGTPDKPYLIGAYAHEEVQFNGTLDIHPHCRCLYICIL